MKARLRLQRVDVDPPFAAVIEPPRADYRGVPTVACPCGCDFFIVCTRFDEETRLPGFYLLDARCASCGAWLTPPTPIDGDDDAA